MSLSIQYVGLITAFSFMVVMDLVGNSLVVLIFFLNKSMRTAMNKLVLNLATADMVVAIFVAIQFVIGPMLKHPSGTTGALLCKFLTGGTMAWTAALVSACNLVAISVERYHAVVHPLNSRSKLTRRKLKFIISGCWLTGCLWNAPLFVTVTFREDLGTCGERWPNTVLPVVYSLGWSVVAGIIPISIMAYLYSRVVYKLWFETAPAVQSASARKATVARKKATITVIAVSVIYVICWIPVLVMYILAQSLPKHKVHSANHQITILLTMFNSSINPIVYSFTSAQFRRRIAKLFRCKLFKVYYGSRLRVYEIPQGSFKASQYESEGSTGRGVF
ncbi:neuropeptide receptor 22-like [Acropora millepora]|uniref:neuropeptide receptor 22-like n=1 Tax=Acropora millepora TaxID=45264 RepID=UPI001CF4EC27|nr:neuropeptide receptor 22-like [Acropora millepora]XP_044175456.1 neuropeptide receptor 22-like [Acropora millepora]XP_044175462.1 neuropeptide receptor 22-like [Acropora millepora]